MKHFFRFFTRPKSGPAHHIPLQLGEVILNNILKEKGGQLEGQEVAAIRPIVEQELEALGARLQSAQGPEAAYDLISAALRKIEARVLV